MGCQQCLCADLGRAEGGALLHGHGFLALAATEVVQAGAADTTETRDLDLGHLRGVQGEDTLDTLAIRDFADCVG